MVDAHDGAGRFPETRHSLVAAACAPDPEIRRGALEGLITAYWRPVYKYVRIRWRTERETAEDLTQSFFASLLERGLVESFDATKAKFRTYLRVCLDGHVSNETKAATRIKRGGGVDPVPLDFEDAEGELQSIQIANDLDPDELFHREWIRGLFSHAVRSLQETLESEHRIQQFQLFERHDLHHGSDRPSYAVLSTEFGIPISKVTNDLHAARKRFRGLLLGDLRSQCGGREEFEVEARELFGTIHP